MLGLFCKLSQKGFNFEGKLMVVVYIFRDLISYIYIFVKDLEEYTIKLEPISSYKKH